MSETTWVGELKEGDRVVLVEHYYGTPDPCVAVVDRVTRTMVRVGSHRFDRQSGREKGQGSLSSWVTLERATPERVAEVRDEIERRRIVAILRDVKWEKHTVETLRAIRDVLASVPPTEEA